jgi:8-oxo-dGTP pyrophosphatase MutT (NUDIX family)
LTDLHYRRHEDIAHDFNEIHYRVDVESINLENGIEDLREAVRAIIIVDDKILMAHLMKTNEYKFPGGGKKENETSEEALKREVLEEVGYRVKNIHEKVGTIIEYSTSIKGENHYFKMISDYYLVDIEDVQLKQNLEKYEEELMYKPCWIELFYAYRTNFNQIQCNKKSTPGIYRETIALEKLIQHFEYDDK